jgi:DNA-binding YbaB/EbfC family protein
MAELFQHAKKVQEELAKVQDALENIIVEGTAGGGIITVTANGKQKVLSVKIDSEIINSEDVEMLEDLVVAAVNQALEKSREIEKEEMQKVAGGMFGNLSSGGFKIPGLNI